MKYMSTTPSGLKCQPKATHWSSMNNEETLIPQGRLQLAPNIIIHRFNRRCLLICTYNNNFSVSEVFMKNEPAPLGILSIRYMLRVSEQRKFILNHDSKLKQTDSSI